MLLPVRTKSKYPTNSNSRHAIIKQNIYPQSGRTLFYIGYARRQSVIGRFATAKICGQTYINR